MKEVEPSTTPPHTHTPPSVLFQVHLLTEEPQVFLEGALFPEVCSMELKSSNETQIPEDNAMPCSEKAEALGTWVRCALPLLPSSHLHVLPEFPAGMSTASVRETSLGFQ
jgi:hypothetical protein